VIEAPILLVLYRTLTIFQSRHIIYIFLSFFYLFFLQIANIGVLLAFYNDFIQDVWVLQGTLHTAVHCCIEMYPLANPIAAAIYFDRILMHFECHVTGTTALASF